MPFKRIAIIVLIAGLIAACQKSYRAEKAMSSAEVSAVLGKLAPFVLKKPDEIAYRQRTNPTFAGFYADQLTAVEGKLDYFVSTDTANFFFFSYRDRTSLFEHYRGLGGYYRLNESDTLAFLDILYHTPRLTRGEMESRGPELFEEMITAGNVKRYAGNKEYIHTPNDDFYYNTTERKWDYTPNSSWKFLQTENGRKD